jgi:uncharacterized protein (TIGR03382 family)
MGGAGGHPDGTEGGACYGNGTCNADLNCVSNLCAKPTSRPLKGCGCQTGGGGATELPLLLIVALLFRRRAASERNGRRRA